MNMTKVVNSLKLQLGLQTISLPFKDSISSEPIPIEKTIMDVMQMVTIPIFSQFAPWMREIESGVRHLEVVDKKAGIYMLPKALTTTDVISVNEISVVNRDHSQAFNTFGPVYGVHRTPQRVAQASAHNMLMGVMSEEPSFQYMGNNKVKLFGYHHHRLLNIRVGCEHLPNGESIDIGCFESFLQLATLDMMNYLYQQLKLYETMGSAYGQIQLKIDHWAGAREERETLLEKWRDTYHLDMGWESFM